MKHRNHRTAVAAAAVTVIVVLLTTTALEAQRVYAREMAMPVLTPEQQRYLESLEESPGFLGYHAVEIDPPITSGDSFFEIELPALGLDGPLVFERESAQAIDPNRLSWVGREEASGHQAALVVRAGRVSGTVWARTVVATIRPLVPGYHLLVEWDPDVIDVGGHRWTAGPQAPEMPSLACGDGLPEVPKSCQEITLVVGYTDEAWKWIENTLDSSTLDQLASGTTSKDELVSDELKTSILNVNIAHGNSEVPLELVLRDVFPVSGFTECCLDGSATDLIQNCNDLMAGVPPLDTVHDQRDIHAADIAILLTGNNKYRSVGIPPNGTDLGKGQFAFAVVGTKYAWYNLVHEIGHMHGALHNPERSAITNHYFPNGYGYCCVDDPNRNTPFHTIMSYSTNSDGVTICPGRIPYWSNPEVSIPPFAADAVPTGTWTTSNVACVLRHTACIVSGFRTEGDLKGPAGPLEFKQGKTELLKVKAMRGGNPVGNTPVEIEIDDEAIVSSSPTIVRTDLSGAATFVLLGVGPGETSVTVRAVGDTKTVQVMVLPWWWWFARVILIALGLVVLVWVAVKAIRRLSS